jgi:hypothetical protein
MCNVRNVKCNVQTGVLAGVALSASVIRPWLVQARFVQPTRRLRSALEPIQLVQCERTRSKTCGTLLQVSLNHQVLPTIAGSLSRDYEHTSAEHKPIEVRASLLAYTVADGRGNRVYYTTMSCEIMPGDF